MIHICITARWLDERYHGQLSRTGPSEWPPSPFRLFEALVSGVARRGELAGQAGKSLEWLQGLAPPIIVAPQSRRCQEITRFVPNNDGDAIPDRQGRLTGKTFRPTLMLASPTVHYIWQGDQCPYIEGLIRASRSITCFGWGIDMAYGDARLVMASEIAALEGIRWHPKPGTQRDDGLLRVPTEGTMDDLIRSHLSALERIGEGKPLKSVRKPQVFDRVFYSSAERPLGRPCVAFVLRDASDDSFRYSHAKLIHISGMTRHAAIRGMNGFADDLIATLIAGHPPAETESHEQFSYIPLPSIGHGHADAMIRRVMIAAPFGQDVALDQLAEQLDGVQLKPESGAPGPILDRVRSDGVVRRYLDAHRVWATVTPVILPGHDDHKPAKTFKLIERALAQSGIDESCEFTWGPLPNFKNCLTARKYDHNRRRTGYYRPAYLESLSAVHMRVAFREPFAGPLAIGAGRHCGFGVMAGLEETASREV
ncbi:MAG: type I-U CRISPR-associated protein Csb2 [Bryobacteraceae bacterium]